MKYLNLLKLMKHLCVLASFIALVSLSCTRDDSNDSTIWDFPIEYQFQMFVNIESTAFTVNQDGSLVSCNIPSSYSSIGAELEALLNFEVPYEGLDRFTLESDTSLSGEFVIALDTVTFELENSPYDRVNNWITVQLDEYNAYDIPIEVDDDLENCQSYLLGWLFVQTLPNGQIQGAPYSFGPMLSGLEGAVSARAELEANENQLSLGDTLMIATFMKKYSRIN